MKKIRLKFMLFIYDWSSSVYATIFKINKKAWGITKEEFLNYPIGTLARSLGEFYQEKGFEVMPKLENHDVFHILTETGTEIEDEIAMQFLLLGNGKMSLYLFGMIFIGGFLFPEYATYYRQSFRKGKNMRRFHDVEFYHLLMAPISILRASYTYPQESITLKIR